MPDLVVEKYCNKSENQKNISDNIPIDANTSKSEITFLEEDSVNNLPSTSSVQNSAMNVINAELTPQIKHSKIGFPSSSNRSNVNKYVVRNTEKILEVPKITLPVDPKEKKDLFKAIFLSSSESEEENEEREKIEEIKKHTEDVVNKPVEKLNPKPGKGIFADLDWSKINKPKTSESTSEQENLKSKQTQSQEQSDDTYGPKLPVSSSTVEKLWKPTFRKITQTIKDTSSSDAEWMEVGSSTSTTTEKSSMKTKKHKKHKSKHKKHKSKSKKKKH